MFGGNNAFGLDLGALLGNMMGRNSNGNNDGFGNNGFGWFAWIILFAIIFGFGRGNWGWGNNSNGEGSNAMSFLPYAIGANGALTRADLCQDMNFQEVKNGVATANAAIQNGFNSLNSTVCQQSYETAGLLSNLGNMMQQGFNAANVVALQNQNQLQRQADQCCCENREGQQAIRTQMAQDTCTLQQAINQAARDIVDNQNAGFRNLYDQQVQLQLQGKDAQIAALSRQLERCDDQVMVNNAVTAVTSQTNPQARPAYIVPNPNYCQPYGYYPYPPNPAWYNNGNCNCNNGQFVYA